MVESVFADDWDHESSRPGYVRRRMRLGRRLGGELLGASVYELEPGQGTWPYHLHHGNEELLLVLEGTPTLQRADGERELAPGDAALFKRGPDGAHKVVNRSGGLVRVLIVSTMIEPDITELPSSGKVGLFAGGAPGAPDEQVTVERFVRVEDVDYFDGE